MSQDDIYNLLEELGKYCRVRELSVLSDLTESTIRDNLKRLTRWNRVDVKEVYDSGLGKPVSYYKAVGK